MSQQEIIKRSLGSHLIAVDSQKCCTTYHIQLVMEDKPEDELAAEMLAYELHRIAEKMYRMTYFQQGKDFASVLTK